MGGRLDGVRVPGLYDEQRRDRAQAQDERHRGHEDGRRGAFRQRAVRLEAPQQRLAHRGRAFAPHGGGVLLGDL